MCIFLQLFYNFKVVFWVFCFFLTTKLTNEQASKQADALGLLCVPRLHPTLPREEL